MSTEQVPEADELAVSGLMDARWYRTRYPDVAAAALEPVDHYLRFGANEGRWPNRYFDTKWYVAQNPDVVSAGLNPAIHYHRHGDLEGRRPHPFMDPAWYRCAYELAGETRALAHFLIMRHTGRHAPCAELWAVPYVAAADGAADPFAAYLDRQGRRGGELLPDLSVVRSSGLLDPNFYLIHAHDVQTANVDPAEHYCRFGWREGRKPNIYFDAAWYVRTNPDLARLRVNPLVHYVFIGERAGRRPVPYFEPDWYRLTYDVPTGQTALGHYLTNRRGQAVSPNRLFDVGWYIEKHAADLGRNRDPFAHYLQAGTLADVDPSPAFDAARYRKRYMGRASRGFRQLITPERDNPLVHSLSRTYSMHGAEREQEAAGGGAANALSFCPCPTLQTSTLGN